MKHCSDTFSFLEHVMIKFIVHLESYRAEIIINLLMNPSSVAQVCAQCQHNQGSNCESRKNEMNNWMTHYTFPIRNSRSEKKNMLVRETWQNPPQPQHVHPAAVWQNIQMIRCCKSGLQSNILPQADASELIPLHLICCLNFFCSLLIYWGAKFIARESWSRF